MKAVYLNENVVVKDNGDQALLLRLIEGDYFHFRGEMARLVVLLYREFAGKSRAVDPQQLRVRLASTSKSFAKIKKQKKCIEEALEYLKTQELLDETAKI